MSSRPKSTPDLRLTEAMEPAFRIELSDTQSHLRIDRREMEVKVLRILSLEGVKQASISIALFDDSTIQETNRRFLDHDWPTDVLSFRLSAPADPRLAGELILSTERALAVSAEVGVDPQAELTLYLVHGLLHLCGYDDRSAEDGSAMRRREAEILTALGVVHTFPPATQDRQADRGGRA